MALESASYISQLNTANPSSTDVVSQADDHLRLIKSVLKNTFPNLDQPVTATPTLLNNPVPTGIICMWSGTIATIPSGWALCNGSNGTPDLRKKFVYGANNTDNIPGSTGGSSSVTLTVGNLPAHSHDVSGSVGASGIHTHTITDPGHAHGSAINGGGVTVAAGAGYLAESVTATTGISVNNGGSHTHAFSATTTSIGSGAAVATMPPWYALAYIMKL